MICSKCGIKLNPDIDDTTSNICIDCEEEEKLLGLVNTPSKISNKNIQKSQIKKFKNQDY